MLNLRTAILHDDQKALYPRLQTPNVGPRRTGPTVALCTGDSYSGLLPLAGVGDLLGQASPGLVVAVPRDGLREAGNEVGAGGPQPGSPRWRSGGRGRDGREPSRSRPVAAEDLEDHAERGDALQPGITPRFSPAHSLASNPLCLEHLSKLNTCLPDQRNEAAPAACDPSCAPAHFVTPCPPVLS